MSTKSIAADFIHYLFISLTGLGAVAMAVCQNWLASAGLIVAFVCLMTMPEDVNELN